MGAIILLNLSALDALKMGPLIKTALLRTFGFLLWTFLSAWWFSLVEYTQIDDVEEKHKLLLFLYDSMASKYNMTIEEFKNFSNLAHEALSEPKPRWTLSASVNFVFQAITTIGKYTGDCVLLIEDLTLYVYLLFFFYVKKYLSPFKIQRTLQNKSRFRITVHVTR